LRFTPPWSARSVFRRQLRVQARPIKANPFRIWLIHRRATQSQMLPRQLPGPLDQQVQLPALVIRTEAITWYLGAWNPDTIFALCHRYDIDLIDSKHIDVAGSVLNSNLFQGVDVK
jgi:hypothetical protein